MSPSGRRRRPEAGKALAATRVSGPRRFFWATRSDRSTLDSDEVTVGARSRFSFILSPWARTWLLTVPLHLLAFVALYVASVRVIEKEILSLAGVIGTDRLGELARKIDEAAALAPTQNATMGHLVRALFVPDAEVDLQMFLTPETSVGPPREVPAEVIARIADFFAGDGAQEIWLSSEQGRERVRGLRRISTGPWCAPCHEPTDTFAVAAMSLDITPMVARVRSRSRRNLGFLILAWGLLLGGMNFLVGRSVQRFGKRLEAQLAAAEAGEPAVAASPELLLDPVSVRVDQAWRGFLDRQRRRQAEVASRLAHSDQLASLGRLAAGLAHEIKNPLAGIQGALELLREDESEQERRSIYDEMLGELNRVHTTLQLLLDSARPSAPKLTPTDPERLILETVQLLRPGFRRHGIDLTYEIAPGFGEVTIDAAKIRQVLVNLVQNAADATGTGGHIVIRAGRFSDGGEGLILAVEDDGPGIAADLQGKIFEPFFTTKFGGTGLGLAIARRLVEQHGGSLQVDSEPGRGTTFYVLLPPVTARPVKAGQDTVGAE